MAAIRDNLTAVQDEIATACSRSGRQPQQIRLIAVTKSQTPAVLRELSLAGILDIGENRLDHLEDMRQSAPAELRIHAIGRLQSRQIPRLMALCQAIHSLCERSHLEQISALTRTMGVTPDLFVQVNTSHEAQKAGLPAEDLPGFLEHARTLPGIRIVGLMTMAPDRRTGVDDDRIRSCFAALAHLAAVQGLSRLSMGMSQDFTLAIQEGATDIRVGTRLFA